MKDIIKKNVGLILFYIAIVLFIVFWTNYVKNTNDEITTQKNAKIQIKAVE